jgi:hypothetical protein
MRRRSIFLLLTLLLAQFLAGASSAQAGDSIKARLYSANASEEVSGTLTLDSYNLAGHLTGGGIDVTVSGVVKSNYVDVEVTGHIVLNCSLNRQSMSGTADNAGQGTSVTMLLHCQKSGGYGGGGLDYLFRLDLALPSSHLQIPADPGEDADSGAKPSGKIQGNPA